MFGKKKLIAAYSCFKRALFLDPFRWDIHTNLGLIFIAKGKYNLNNIDFCKHKYILGQRSNTIKMELYTIY